MAISERKSVPLRLLVRPRPLKGESLRGYVLRVAEQNGYGKCEGLWLALMGKDTSRFSVTDEHAGNIIRGLSLSQEKLCSMSYGLSGDGHNDGRVFFGHRISRHFLRKMVPVVCPNCLSEQNAINGLWDLAAICCCPQHGNWLINRCPSCCDELKWQRSAVARCHCGFDLRKVKTYVAPPEVVALTTLIHEVVFREFPAFSEKELGFPSEVREVRLAELLELFRYATNTLLDPNDDRDKCLDNAIGTFRTNALSVLALAKVLKDWPHNLNATLAGFCDVDSATTLASTEFRSAYRKIFQLVLSPSSFYSDIPNFFIAALLQFQDDYFVGGPGEGRYLNPLVVWINSDGDRVLYLDDCLAAMDLPATKGTNGELIKFSDFLRMKLEHKGDRLGFLSAQHLMKQVSRYRSERINQALSRQRIRLYKAASEDAGSSPDTYMSIVDLQWAGFRIPQTNARSKKK